MDSTVIRIQDWLRAHEQELLDEYRALLKIPSIESEAQPNAPFGIENRRALDFMLQLGEKWGMRCSDIEGYAGYAEFGAGERLIMSLGHLDVVPVGKGWKHEPFGAEIDGEYVYARGAVDDKGPTMASFFAMRAIQECNPDVPARMRSVFGCNEESGFKCIERYVQTEEAPTYGVAPDSGWPLYHAEKGIADLIVSLPLPAGPITILEIRGGQRPNIVIDQCMARFTVQDAFRTEVEAKIADNWDKNLIYEKASDGSYAMTAIGKASHGAWPIGGDSAAARILRGLQSISPLEQQNLFTELFEMTHIAGVGLGIHGGDEPSGDLTCNLGVVKTENGMLSMLFNIRYPVTWTGKELFRKCRTKLDELSGDYVLTEGRDSAPLYFPLDHPLVKTICEVYKAETGENDKPGTMGGGTYARAIANTVSIGTGWDGDGKAHENDERLKIEHLFKMSRIYAHILWRLANLP